jgi:alkylation response protein AidB-like acyl-CoA dehydrogenase
VRTTAVRRGDEYVINGSKTFISNGFLCDLVIVVAKTDPDAAASGVSLIVVEADRAGFSRGRNLEKLGQHGQDTCELFFDDVRVPVGNLLGDAEGRGFVQLMSQLPQERLLVGVIAHATMQKAVELTVAYAKEREAFGRPLLGFQNTQFVLAECDTVTTVAQSFLDDCVVAHLAGELDVVGAAKAKWWLTEQQNVVVDRCVQVFGGYGYMTEYPIARLFADSRIQKIYGGSNEIMKTIIAKAL